MQPLLGNVAALGVAIIFYAWRGWAHDRHRKDRRLRERVAYMLWVTATGGAIGGREASRAMV